MRSRHRRVLVVLDLVLVTAAIAALLTWQPVPSAAQAPAFTIHKVDSATFSPQHRTEPFFVLLIGNDARAGLDGIRGDGLHVLGVNPAAGSAVILNIPRDTYVPIPGLGSAKINDAYKQAGFAKQVETVSAFTGIPFSFVVETDFDGFVRLVDEMGGVEVEVPYRMFDRNSGADFAPGRVHMFGHGALSFARNRNIPNGDISRTHHQGLLLVGALERARAVGTTPFAKMRMLGMIARHTRVEGVGYRDLFSLLGLGLSLDPANVRNVTMPSAIGKVGAADVVFPGDGAAGLFADLGDDAVLQHH
ncbi:MAG TPA: LCP family protein [Acidimicrobiales bacterium]|nr:LCP family protein [Acidimicrobiales bacterium]